ncbi:MAG: helix-turn-helix domain-containing protein [Sedimenticola sp.]
MFIPSPKAIAVHLKDVRIQQKRSQTDLSEWTGLRQATISDFERSPDKSQLGTLFKLLGELQLELHITQIGGDPRIAENSDLDW